ncbi:MAG: bacillithiol biosynthesis deacetylase BshB1 [Bergeyella sp.]|nr:bacillithiol biosynthesis deacetylase BshB1 [Bergeyella sp.]
MEKVDYLVFGAHPDDVELGCGGTVAKLISQGRSVAVVDLTEGELGTRGSGELRRREASRASEILGVSFRENLRFPDGFFDHSAEYKLKVVQSIRKYSPEIVLANAMDDRHPDHARAAKLVSDACFLSGLRRVETLDEKGFAQKAWRPKHVFHYIQWKSVRPDFVIDISRFMELKISACKAYSSQFYDPDSKEPETPISSVGFFDSITYRAQDLGRLSGVDYAEGFTCERLIALENFEGIVL